MALMNIVYTCFSIIRGYVTASYVMFYWKISYKKKFLRISIYCITVWTCNGTDILVINTLNIISNNTNDMHL